MFGYVRPLKPELLVREFSRYKSIYCGICKQIGRDYGQLPRLTLGYDLTLLAVLLLSLSDDQPPDRLEGCILNPVAKKPIVQGGLVLELCAALTVLLAWHKTADDIKDENTVKSRAAKLLLARAHRRAATRYGEYDQIMLEELQRLAEAEAGDPNPKAAEVFGHLLYRLFKQAAGLVAGEPEIIEAIAVFGRDLGVWIYILDAIDDFDRDWDNNQWNPFGAFSREDARAAGSRQLQDLEAAMDRTAALLPYRRDSGLLANIVTQGLPAIREQIFRGDKLARL